MIIVNDESNEKIVAYISWNNYKEYLAKFDEIYENKEAGIFRTGPFQVVYESSDLELLIITDSEQSVVPHHEGETFF